MTPDIARWVVLAGSLVGIAAWALALVRSLGMLRQGASREAVESAEARGGAREVSERIAKALVSQTNWLLSSVRIKAADETGVTFGAASKASITPLTGAIAGQFRIRPGPAGAVKVELHLEPSARVRAAKIALGIVFLFGLPTLLAVPILLFAFVVNHPEPAVRWQAVQIVQIVHPLWPPFLFLWQGRRFQGVIEQALGQILDRIRFE